MKKYSTLELSYYGEKTKEFPNGKVMIYDFNMKKELLSEFYYIEDAIAYYNERGWFISASENSRSKNTCIFMTKEG